MPTLIKVTPSKDRRPLHYGDKGNDVKAYQRMLRRTLEHLGLVATNRQSGLFGKGTLQDTIRLQFRLKIKGAGVVDLATWEAVDPQMHAYERLLLKLKPPPVATLGQRIAHQMLVMVALGMPSYSQRRPAAATLAIWRRIGSDCSASAYLARAIVLAIAYSGYGNTGTMWSEWPHIAEKDRQVGDHAIYGDWSRTKHVQVLTDVKTGASAGFGSAPGNVYPYRQRSDFMGFVRPAAA